MTDRRRRKRQYELRARCRLYVTIDYHRWWSFWILLRR